MEGPFEKAERWFEEAHAEDVRSVEVDGETLPWLLHYHRRLVHFVETLAPNAPEALRLAARCAHIRRWSIKREDYDEGRSGYKKWRSDLARFHGQQAAKILRSAGYGEEIATRVQDILQKKRLKLDPDVQTFENGLCLVFLEIEFADFSTKHDEEKLIGIVQKTWKKMSEPGHAVAMTLAGQLSEGGRALIEKALKAP